MNWDQSRLHGMDGFAASAEHAHMMRHFMTKLLESAIEMHVKGGHGLTSIDDFIWVLWLGQNPTKRHAYCYGLINEL